MGENHAIIDYTSLFQLLNHLQNEDSSAINYILVLSFFLRLKTFCLAMSVRDYIVKTTLAPLKYKHLLNNERFFETKNRACIFR